MVNIPIDCEIKLYNDIFENTLLCNKRKIFKKTCKACRWTNLSSKLNLFSMDNDHKTNTLMARFFNKFINV